MDVREKVASGTMRPVLILVFVYFSMVRLSLLAHGRHSDRRERDVIAHLLCNQYGRRKVWPRVGSSILPLATTLAFGY